MPEPEPRSAWMRWLERPTPSTGLAAFRILFGALMLLSVARFWARGWIDELYIDPSFHFTYLGFGWVRPWPAWGMALHFAVMGAAALALMLGAYTRWSAALFLLTFTYAELLEKAAYLNHYYLVSLLALLLVVVPAGATWSVDAWRRGDRPTVGRWAYVLLRAQVAVVYVFAGLAKLDGDWLLRAEPLRTWLSAHADLPLVGALLTTSAAAYAMSWGGMLYDLSIVAWLSWRPTRRVAYLVSIFFHVSLWILFPIGVFSWVMLASATLFFDPAWPQRLVARLRTRAPSRGSSPSDRPGRLHPVAVGLGATYLLVQVVLPCRHVLHPGAVNWTEQGYRFAWRVMLIEKTGQVEYEVFIGDEARFMVHPRRELTTLQYRMMSTQPDMIHEYALALAERYRERGHDHVRVHAHAWAALNGRPSQRLIDPSVDLASQPRSLRTAPWIVPLQDHGSEVRPRGHASAPTRRSLPPRSLPQR
ncbi:HTTM domain-containing protein [Paraliomyxa miuraensis]|uniref:HTTM domain-containing protein n=1 Tax=Paraliomyxa miuraensis TaxID=376150 RepID=UPI0022598965|nr:HTTM domain-containing protein [Paraliomyxa miuraensis]MCX4247558.1 HTTM domain-containing protein [Paraliomyxa miuraensis]